MSNSQSGLPYDELGFLIGLKQTGRDVAKIDMNVEAIRDILLKLQKEFEGKFSGSQQQFTPRLSALEQALIDAQIKPVDIADLIKEQANPIIQTTVVLDRVAKSLEDFIDDITANKNSHRSRTTQAHREAIEIDSPESVISDTPTAGPNNQSNQGQSDSTQRNRDSRGRFTGDGSSDNENKSKIAKVIQGIGTGIGTAIKGVMPNSPQGVDPTVDAINEVAAVLSPIKRAAGFMLRPLTGWMKSRKRNEPLPKEQSDHNRKQIKLLQRLVDNLQSRGGLLGGLGKLLGAGGGLLGSLFGGLLGKGKGLGKGLAKFLKFGKGLPVIGALLTAMSFSDWGTKSNKEKGGAVGGTAGGVIGGAIGSIFGPIGTVAGAGLGAIIGEKVGSVAAPYIKQWTDSLIAADIPSMISKLFSAAFNLTPGGIAKSLVDWGKEKWNSTFNGQHNPSYLMRRQYGGKGVNGEEPAQFGAAAKAVNGNQKQIIGQMYNAATAAGFSHKQAIALLGDIGRENDFQLDNIFGSHKDPARGENLGMVSWQGDRRKNLEKYLSGRGLLNADGTIKRSQEGLQAQFEFAKMEMENNKKWKQGFLDKKDISIEEARPQLGGSGSYFGWARGQETIRRGDGTRVPFNSQAQENKANRYSKAAEDIVGKDSDKKAEVNAANKQSTSQTAEVMMQKAKMHVPFLNMQASVQPIASRSDNFGSGYVKSKFDTNIQPAKEYLNSPAPQEVIVRNQNNGNITQNVSNRLLAHAITGGLGMGDKFNG